MMATLAEQLARRVRVAAGPHDNPDMTVQQVVSAMAAQIAELEDKTEELDRLLKEALMAFDIICPECRKQWLHRHCGRLPATEKDQRISAQQWLLEQCQQSLRESSETYVELDAYLRGDIDHNEVLAIKAEHEAALSQQGKANES